MTRDAQIPRVTSRAARRDRIWARGDAGYSCRPAVAANQKIRRAVRLRFWEARDNVAGQAWCVSQSQVTGRASGAGNIDVGRLECVTVQALLDYCVLRYHPR